MKGHNVDFRMMCGLEYLLIFKGSFRKLALKRVPVTKIKRFKDLNEFQNKEATTDPYIFIGSISRYAP